MILESLLKGNTCQIPTLSHQEKNSKFPKKYFQLFNMPLAETINALMQPNLGMSLCREISVRAEVISPLDPKSTAGQDFLAQTNIPRLFDLNKV
ncbi:hypothetical protein D0962_21615 [Leptolyngbyaceae cyanobacterium CCMR0082]|uniref:Uncharacterized protein n=2 Tax=Adonisia turfae TaxID=2950184 RepID=A0A6M0SA07_9CYAN|nr:hypothetical protein [Adonisia turfae CCMR0081]NEZ65338.1 hypothetical protein [Adonisia turfae CCMR0082]